ncbi:hypothetical protein LCGC14_3043100, partial [marine sediment metagenome]
IKVNAAIEKTSVQLGIELTETILNIRKFLKLFLKAR